MATLRPLLDGSHPQALGRQREVEVLQILAKGLPADYTVCLVGPQEIVTQWGQYPEPILGELPDGAVYRRFRNSPGYTFAISREMASFSSPEEGKNWIREMLNQFVNVFRPMALDYLHKVGG